MKVLTRIDKLTSLRKQGFIPGVLCGLEGEPANIQVEQKDFLKTLSSNGQTNVFPCEFEGTTQQVYIRDVQREVLRRENFQHFTLQIVSATDRIHAQVQIHVKNKELIESQGLMVNHVLHQIDVKFGASEKLEDIVIDVEGMNAGDALTLGDIDIPAIYEVLTPMEAQVLSIISPRSQQTEDDLAVAEVAEVVEVENVVPAKPL